jgi:hypothetical protein
MVNTICPDIVTRMALLSRYQRIRRYLTTRNIYQWSGPSNEPHLPEEEELQDFRKGP